MIHIAFMGRPALRAEWEAPLRMALNQAGLAATLDMTGTALGPAETDYVIYAPNGPVHDLRPYRRLRGILSLWAGVETLLSRDDLPPGVPVVRMVEPGLTEGMTDYVCAHALYWHTHLHQFAAQQRVGLWREFAPPLSRDRRVGVLGLGALGRDAAQMLRQLRFQVAGYSRSEQALPGIACFHGPAGLAPFLAQTEILVVLVPLTPQTRGLLNAATLAQLPKGAALINAARGPVIDTTALLAALDSGHLRGASLDVFDTEPLPADSPLWTHPQVLLTPHVAAATRPESAAAAVVAQITRIESGLPPQHVVDFARGY